MHAPRAFPDTLPGFQQMFPTEADCIAYLERVRFSDGFACPACGVAGDPYRVVTRPTVLVCRACRHEVRLTAGTIMHRSKIPVCVWFWGAYLVSAQTPGMSALQFARQLGIRTYETAFMMLHKLRAGMVNPERERIGGKYPVEVDETLLGGRTRGEGRGVHHMEMVIGAVEVRTRKATGEDRREKKGKKRTRYAGRLRLLHISTDSADILEGFVTSNILPGSAITTDGSPSYDGLSALGYRHNAVPLRGDPDLAEKWLPMIHIVFSNIKTWLLGTHHGVSPKHLQAYLNEYVFRFNRRFYPMSAFNSVLGIGARVGGPTYDALYRGEWTHPNPLGVVGYKG